MRERPLLEREADRAPLAADRAHEDRDLLRRGPGTDEPLDVAGDALRLRALVRALPEAHLARLGRGGLDRPRLAVGDRVDDRAGAREDALRAPERSLEADDRRVGMAAAERGRVAPGGPGAAGERLVVVGERADGGGWGRIRAARGPAPQLLDDEQRRGREVLQVVDEDVAVARTDARADVRAIAQQPQGAQHQVAGVERVGLDEQSLVREVELGELALPRAVGLIRPRREALGVDAIVLQPVDARDDARHERGGAAAEVVLAQRQLVEVLEQHRQPVRAPQRYDERIEPGLQRLVVQDARTEVVDRVDRELLVRAVDRLLQERAQPARGRGGGDEREDGLRMRAVGHEPGEALDEDGRLAGPRPSDDEQRSTWMPDDAGLRGRQVRHVMSLRPEAHDPGTRSMGRVTAEAIVLEADWLGTCRRAVRGLRGVLSDHPTSRERVVETGERGGGGDRTLVIDRQVEDVVFAELERLHADGLRFCAVSEERGIVDFGGDGVRVVIDPIDGSLNAKRGLPNVAISIAVANGPTMADVEFAYVYDLGPGEEWWARRGEGTCLNDRPLVDVPPERRDRNGRLELVALESASPYWIARGIEGLERSVRRIRAIGTIAVSMSQVADARVDGMLTLRGCRAVDVAAAQLIVRESGGHVAFPACETELGAPLDLVPHSPVVAARTRAGLEDLAAIVVGAKS